MNTRANTLLASLCLGLAACSPGLPDEVPTESVDPGADAIIGGTLDKGDPSVVLMKAESGNSGWWCTGTVIAPRLVLTAAHCVEDADGSTKMRVMFGSDEATAKATDYIAVKEWHHDPKYMATNNIAAGHDAAVLILAEDAKAAPLAINHTALTNAMNGSPVHVVGFGNDNGQQGTGAGKKREIHTALASLEQGVVNVGKPGQTTCQGDSGGPSFMTIGGATVIVGITSYGEQGCVNYGSMTRVDLAASWIDPYIAANGGGGGGGTCKPACDGRVCGADGCGGVCGTCDGGAECSAAGQCASPKPPPPPPPGGACVESEPNDGPSGATAMCVSGAMTGRISTAWDSDWYSWKVPANRTYTIDLKTDHEYVMTLYKVVSGGSLYEITSAFDEIAKKTPDGGTYYLEVWGGNGDYSATDEYNVSMAITK